jgi:hypothetical protein
MLGVLWARWAVGWAEVEVEVELLVAAVWSACAFNVVGRCEL